MKLSFRSLAASGAGALLLACSATGADPWKPNGGDGGSGGTGGAAAAPSVGGTSSGGTSTGGASAGGTSSGGASGAGRGGMSGTGSGGTSSGGSGGTSGGSGGSSSGGTSGGSGGTSGGSGGTSGGSGGTSGGSGGSSSGGTGGGPPLERFSFFVTSLAAVRAVSGSANGFGGDLRHGQADGLAGADEICALIAERSMPGSRAKSWRAFLSTSTVNARDRIGNGPWYDRLGRLISSNLNSLLQTRPGGADSLIVDDLPNEDGVPNRAGSAEGSADDNHDTVTGSTADGRFAGQGTTCNDWTNKTASGGRPMMGHTWPARSGMSWIQAHPAPGCTPSVSLVQTGPGSGTGIGNGGGYGGFYCFALTP